jgi:hypothetical protein
MVTVHGSRLTVHGSRFTAHGSRLTVHGSRFIVAVAQAAEAPALLLCCQHTGLALEQHVSFNAKLKPLHQQQQNNTQQTGVG